MVKKTSLNKQHCFLWIGLAVLGLGFVFLAVLVVTGGTREQSSAQTSFTFTEEFDSTIFKDTEETTAAWDTTNSALHLKPEMTSYKADYQTIGKDNIKPTPNA